MSNVKEIFNILLLSISLSTVLITLVSFIIFKFRYNYNKKDKQGLYQLKGSFFKRFAPHLEIENAKVVEERKLLARKSMSPQKKLIITFASFTFFIFAFLSAENYLTFRKQIAKNNKDANRIKQLVRQGLLQKRDFNPLKTQATFEEFFTVRQKTQYKNLLNAANKLNVVLIIDRRNSEKNQPNYNIAFERWKQFLNRNEIPYRISGISGIREGDFIILPQLRYLSSEQIAKLKESVGKSKMLFTGLPGKSNSMNSIVQELTKIKFIENKKTDLFLPTQLIGTMGMPAGLTLPWYPLDQVQIPAGSKELQSFSRVSGHNGEPIEDYVVRDFYSRESGVTWTMLDPLEKASFHADYFLLALITRGSDSSFIEIANWKRDENKAVFSMTVDSEDKFERIDKFLELFKKEKLKASFFLVSDLMNEFKDIELKENGLFEFATHTNDHKSMLSKTLKQQFFDLEESRFDIEERVGSRVHGIRPPKEEIDEEALSAIVQNGFEYVFGPNKKLSFSPEIVAEGDIVFLPRTLSDDFEFYKNKFIIKQNLMLRAMERELDWIKSSNGAHFLSLHTQIAGEDLPFKTIEMFVKDLKRDGLWITTVDKVSTWWREKESLEINSNGKSVEIRNHGKDTVKDFDIRIYNPMNLDSSCFKRGVSSHSEHLVLRVAEIKPGDSVSLCVGD